MKILKGIMKRLQVKKKKILRAATDWTEISNDLAQKRLKMIHKREFPAAHKRSS